MEQEIKNRIERLFIIKQKIKNLEAQAEAIEVTLPDLSGTGTKIEFPATQERPGFSVWQQTSKRSSFKQLEMKGVYGHALESGDESFFDITLKAEEVEKIRKGKSDMDRHVGEKVLAAIVVTEGKASWRFKAEVADEQE